MGIRKNSLGKKLLLFVLIVIQGASWAYLADKWRSETVLWDFSGTDLGNDESLFQDKNTIATRIEIIDLAPENHELTVSVQAITSEDAMQDKFRKLVATAWPNEDFESMDNGFYLSDIGIGLVDVIDYMYSEELGNFGTNAKIFIFPTEFCPDCANTKLLALNLVVSSDENIISFPSYAKGWYPFEKYFIAFNSTVSLQSFDQENESFKVDSTLRFHSTLSNYDFSTTYDFVDNYDMGISMLVIERHLIFKLLFMMVLALFVSFSTALFTVEKLSNFLEVATALLLGTWGFKEIILPDNLPFRVSYGGYLVIMLIYANLGITTIFWFINNFATNNSYKLFQAPQKHQLLSETKYLTTKEAAYYLSVSESTIYRLFKNGAIDGEKSNNRRVYYSKSIIDYKKRKEEKSR